MFNKLFLAAALIALPLMLTQEKASAFGGMGIGYGMPGYGHGIGPRPLPLPVPPRHSVHRSHRIATPYPSFRPDYGHGRRYRGYGRACSPYGYGAHYGGSPYSRSGISLHFGF